MSLDDQAPNDEEMNGQIEEDQTIQSSKTNQDQIVSTEHIPSVKRNTKYRQHTSKSKKGTQICLQRISQRVKKTNGFFWSGHMFYYTNSNTTVINTLVMNYEKKIFNTKIF